MFWLIIPLTKPLEYTALGPRNFFCVVVVVGGGGGGEGVLMRIFSPNQIMISSDTLFKTRPRLFKELVTLRSE